jgi:hypothetical protein
MACAKFDFYTPKNSSRAQILEARENLQKMRAMIPLTEDEQAAVDDGNAALDRLADIPTPAGRHPGNSIPRAAPPSSRSSISVKLRQGRSDNSDSTE